MGGSVACIGLAYLIFFRALEFEEDDGRVYAVYSLTGGDVAFYAGERQLEGISSPLDTVEVRFRGAVLVRANDDSKGQSSGITAGIVQNS